MTEITYPGVYVSPSIQSRAIVSASTSITLFVGRTASGTPGQPTTITGMADFTGQYGAVSSQLPLSLAVRDFFNNGGSDAVIMRIGADTPLTDIAWLDGVNALPVSAAFNIFCLTPDVLGQDVPLAVVEAVTALCVTRGAMAILPPPAAWQTAFDAGDYDQIAAESLGSLPLLSRFAAATYFPDILVADPVTAAPIAHPPCGAAAGVWAAADMAEGVWKAPAGIRLGLNGVLELSALVNDSQDGVINENGVNAVRQFPNYGTVIWGARTLAGVAGELDGRRYISGARLINYIEQSLVQSLTWVVFEPNGPPLWTAIVQEVSTFMQTLWLAGGLFGNAANQAYAVTCDATTTTPADIAAGIVNVVISAALGAPVEFTTIEISLTATPPE